MTTTQTLAACIVAVLCGHAQNLIRNGDFEGGNAEFSNDYAYSPSNMQPQGVYCVAKSPAQVHGSWAEFGDHTLGTGLMLIANGDANPTNVVWRQTVTVAKNTDHLFSAWAASAYHENPAQFHFFVNGEQAGSPVALPSTTGLWQNYSVIWSSGEAESARLEIRMLTTHSFGNDFALDDLSFRRLSATTPPPPTHIEKAVEVSWPSVSAQLYQVQWASETDTNQWFSLGPLVVGNGWTNSVYDLLGANAKRFYRVIPVD